MFAGISGANSWNYRIYTWRGGKLVESRSPGWAGEWSFSGGLRWSQEVRVSNVKGIRQLAIGEYQQVTPGRWSGTIRVHRWLGGGWRFVTEQRVGGAKGIRMARPGGFVGAGDKPVFT